MKGKRELPEGWKWASLGNISLKISKGTTPTTLGHNFLSAGVPFLRAEDVVGGAVDPSKVVFHISKQTHDYLSRSQLKVGDLLITIAGTLGRVGYVPQNSSSLNCNQAVAFVRLKPDIIDPRYACFVCQNTSFYNSLIGLKATSTISNLNLEQIKEAKIPLPPTLNDQIRIAGELERKMVEVETMRQAALRQKEAAAAMQGAILREVFPRKEGDELPDGWRWMPFKDVCLINPRKRKDFSREPDEQTSFVPMGAVDDITGRISNIIKRSYSEISKGYTFFEDGDVLFAKITPCMQNGKSAIAQNLIDGLGFGSTEFHVLRPGNNITKEWLYYYVRTNEFRKSAKDHFEGSAGQQRVSKHFLENSLIPLPPTLDDQIRIAGELERKMAELDKMRQAAEQRLEVIEALPGAILREVFNFEEDT